MASLWVSGRVRQCDHRSLYSEAALSPVSPDSTGVPGSSAGKASLTRGDETNVGHQNQTGTQGSPSEEATATATAR